MKSTPIAACLAILVALSSPSCMSKEDKALLEKARSFENLLLTPEFDKGPKPHGSIVLTKYVDSCLKTYDSLMPHHGFCDTAIDTSINITRTIKITRQEEFRGHELLDFLAAAAQLHDSLIQGNGDMRMSIQIKLGVYNDYYLQQYPDSTGTKHGRIGVFLVTCKWSDQKGNWIPLETKDFKGISPEGRKKMTLLSSGDDPYSFDFGGLKP